MGDPHLLSLCVNVQGGLYGCHDVLEQRAPHGGVVRHLWAGELDFVCPATITAGLGFLTSSPASSALLFC